MFLLQATDREKAETTFKGGERKKDERRDVVH